MYPYAVIFSMLISTSLIMSVTMAISWSSLGEPAHAITWSVAFGLNALQVIFNAFALMSGRPPMLMAATVVLTMLPCALIAIGARQRVGLPNYFGRFIAAGLFVLGVTTAVMIATPRTLVYVGIPSFFTSAMMVLAVTATVPRGRWPLPAEWAMIVIDAAFASVQLIIAVLAIFRHSHPDDVLLKQLHESALGIGLPAAFIGSGIVRVLLIASDLAAQLRHHAERDPLTGLLNRRGFEVEVSRALARTGDRGELVTLAMADVDHFKVINDRFGHARGDEVLIRLAREFESILGPRAIISRLGGEEFGAMVLQPMTIAGAKLEHLRHCVRSGSVAMDGLDLSISIGAAEIQMAAGNPAATLSLGLAAADAALYRAKAGGRDKLVIAGPCDSPRDTIPGCNNDQRACGTNGRAGIS